jgi:cyclophilin family peptidyl-prolyl cis-trans isomerase/HEAT repeat protein
MSLIRVRFRPTAVLCFLLAFVVVACKTAAPPPVKAPTVSFEQKMAWIFQLEDQRILRIDAPPPVAPPPVTGRGPRVPPPPPPSTPDLIALLSDPDPRLRRRAALAIGRVGLADGVKPLSGSLADSDPEVRQTAAFGLGLIGDVSASAALVPALMDTAIPVRGRAAEALGLIGATDAAAAVGKLAADYVRHPVVAAMKPDDETWPAPPEAEAFKLALFALVRLGAWDALASAVIDGDRTASQWWPVAYALQRINDPRAQMVLRQLASSPGKYTAAFALRGLGRLKDPTAGPVIVRAIDGKQSMEVTVAAIRAAGELRVTDAVDPIVRIAADSNADPNLRLEAVKALGTLRAAAGLAVVQDYVTDPWPAMRIAAIQSAAAIDPETFVIVLASLEADAHWTVRSAMADVLTTLPAEIATERLREMLADDDKRVQQAVLRAMARVKVPDLPELLRARVSEPDFGVRTVVAELLGELKPAEGAEALRDMYKRALPDLAYDARAAAIAALAEYGSAEATETLKAALADREWAVRVRAAELLDKLEPGVDHRAAMRPAPGTPPAPYTDPTLLAPATSPHVFIETGKGNIEFELAVIDAPQTTRNFINLARKGFFNGLAIHRVVPNFVVQDGDARGDGSGGPGFTIRDELNDRPFLRGTVGMALSWKDTGGSQFFITHSPQPHLDAKYTVFGHVVVGMDVVDRIQQGDVIQRVRVWDGQAWQ